MSIIWTISDFRRHLCMIDDILTPKENTCHNLSCHESSLSLEFANGQYKLNLQKTVTNYVLILYVFS